MPGPGCRNRLGEKLMPPRHEDDHSFLVDKANHASVGSQKRRGATTARRGRPLCRDFVGDARSAELAESIAAHQKAISEHEGAMVHEIAEFNGAESWRADGTLSMRDWLVARLHVSDSRARRLVQASEHLPMLPALSSAVCDGRVPLDVAASVAKVATRRTTPRWPSRRSNGRRGRRRNWSREVKGQTTSDSAGDFRRRCVRFNDEQCSMWARLPKDGYAQVKSALWTMARRHDHPSKSDPDYERFESRCADALVDVCVGGRRKREDADDAESEYGRATVVVHADLERLLHGDGYGNASIEGAGPISAEVARRVACNADVLLSLDAPDGTVLDQRALGRDPTDTQRIEIRRRDGGCRFPGLHVSQRDGRAPRDVGLQAGPDRHVEPADALRRAPLAGARAGLEARRRCAGRRPVHQPERTGLDLDADADLAPTAEMSRRLACGLLDLPHRQCAPLLPASRSYVLAQLALRSGRSTLTPLRRGRVSHPGRSRSFPAGFAPAECGAFSL